jgi:hypothetical protein
LPSTSKPLVSPSFPTASNLNLPTSGLSHLFQAPTLPREPSWVAVHQNGHRTLVSRHQDLSSPWVLDSSRSSLGYHIRHSPGITSGDRSILLTYAFLQPRLRGESIYTFHSAPSTITQIARVSTASPHPCQHPHERIES